MSLFWRSKFFALFFPILKKYTTGVLRGQDPNPPYGGQNPTGWVSWTTHIWNCLPGIVFAIRVGYEIFWVKNFFCTFFPNFQKITLRGYGGRTQIPRTGVKILPGGGRELVLRLRPGSNRAGPARARVRFDRTGWGFWGPAGRPGSNRARAEHRAGPGLTVQNYENQYYFAIFGFIFLFPGT